MAIQLQDKDSAPAPTRNPSLLSWVRDMAALCKPDKVVWCDGSEEERVRLTKHAVETGVLIPLNPKKRPGCYLHRSNPNDVARVEHLTFICTPEKDEAGPTNNWMAPAEAYSKLTKLFDGSMKGRTMYVLPYVMGPLGSPLAKVGIELTDSVYVALNMRIMTRLGKQALDLLGNSPDFNHGLHCTGDVNPERRFICHFPQDNTIWSFGSGYGGNALLGKKCLALRIGSYLGRSEGWFAEHMLILGVESPDGQTTYVTGAFPSACGKTNFAMLIPPKRFADWKVWTVGDDIAWMRVAKDGRLWAVNPENGYFGVAPGTNFASNPNAMASIAKDTIFTNVAMTQRRRRVVGGHGRPGAGRAHRLAGPALEEGQHGEGRPPQQPLHRADDQQPGALPAGERPGGRAHLGHHFRRPARHHRPAWCCRASTGATASSSAPPWARKPPPPPPEKWAWYAATRWPCCPSVATTWATTCSTGCRCRAKSPTRRRFFRSTGSAKAKTGSSCGPASAKTCGC